MVGKTEKGFTLVESLVVIGIIGLITAGLSALTFWGFRLWKATQDHIKAQDEARAAFEHMAGEIREMQISDNGSYPLVLADSDTLIFFANVDEKKLSMNCKTARFTAGQKNPTAEAPPNTQILPRRINQLS
jgi:prepilin-type N-terminal cleavage/methylation domain-containing protein